MKVLDSNQKAIATSKPTTPRNDQLREVASMYEKQFLRELVKSMRTTVDQAGFVEKNMAEDIFQEQLDHEYVEKWGDKGGIGLADIIYDQLHQQFGDRMRSIPKRGSYDIQPVVIENVRPSELKSPWPGKVQEIKNNEKGNQEVLIQHDNGLQTQLSLPGSDRELSSVHLIKDQPIFKAGPQVPSVSWTVRPSRSQA